MLELLLSLILKRDTICQVDEAATTIIFLTDI